MLYLNRTCIEGETMITKDRASSIISLLFIGIILVLTINLVSQFTFVDFAYLIFLIGCFARFIYIKTH